MLENVFYIKYTFFNPSMTPIIWDSISREKALEIMKNYRAACNGELRIEANSCTRFFVRYDAKMQMWDICKHANGRFLYYGRSYKQAPSALNRLVKLTEMVKPSERK